MIEPFLCRVSPAGVPHNIIHSRDKGYNVSGLSPANMCKLYWTLSGITVSYTFSINYMSVKRTISARTKVRPKYRLIAPIELYETGYDAEFDTAYMCRLNLDVIYLVDDGTLGIRLFVSEIDSTDAIQFTMFPEPDMSHVAHEFQFMDNVPAKIYLNYNPDVVEQASIDQFDFNLEFVS